MANVNISSIMKKVEHFGRSVNGKLMMKDVIQKYSTDGKNETAAGSKVITETSMLYAASKLIGVLRSTAQSYSLPASVQRHFDSLDCSEIFKRSDGSSAIYIYFTDDLHRESLYSDEYSDGVRNIVAVLNNGYQAKDYVYGYWDGHSPTGESVFDGRSIDSDAYIRSRKNREGLHFIQQAVRDFNGNYGSDYNVTAVAGEEYN